VFIAFRHRRRKERKILYVWSTLLAGPQGHAIMADVVTWILDATLRPPSTPVQLNPATNNLQVILAFHARSILDYTLQYRTNLNTGVWSLLNDFSSAPTNRTIRFTNNIGVATSRFYHLSVGP